MLGVALVAAVAVSLALTLSPGRATSGGNPYVAPDVVDTNPAANVVETTIIADENTVDIGNGVTAHAQTYNGTIPGPTFHLKIGDTVIVHYENHLARPSAIHWHGIELSNEMDGTPFTQNQVAPGGSFLYKFKVLRPGLFWYHPHHHSSTNEVFKGLYGMIIVADPNDAPLQANATIPSAADTHPIVLSDTTVCKQPPGNDTATYSSSLPHVSGGMLPNQLGPTPKTLCETTPIDEDGAPLGAPYNVGDIPAIQTAATNGRTNEGQTVLTNGKNVGGRAGTPAAPGALAPGASTMDVKARQGVRLQLLNASAVRYMRLRLTLNDGTLLPLTRIGGEGGLLNNAVDEGNVLPVPAGTFDTGYEKGELLLPPGTRADVAFGIPANATGVATMWTEDYDRTGQGFSNIPTVPVMHLKVNGSVGSTFDIAGGDPLRAMTGDLVETLPAAANTLLDPTTFNPVKKGMASQTIDLTAVANNKLGINGIVGEHDGTGDFTTADHLDSSRYAKEGDTLELDVHNTTNANHPFHLHGFSIQPISLTKAGGPNFTWPYPEFRDNVDIPKNYTLHFKLRIEARPMADGTTPGGALGRWVFHCHIFFHATNGMLSELVVGAANGNERPDIDAATGNASVEQDAQATMTGRYKDRDNNPVTLAASIGTVTDTGGGHWSWKYPTTAADSSKPVYITATDSTGLKSQTAFELQIHNTAPTLIVPGDQTTSKGSTHSFAVSTSDPNKTDKITLGATGLPAGLKLTDKGNGTGTVSGRVTAKPGTYVATLSANDAKHPAPVTKTVKIIVLKRILTGIVGRPARLSRGAIGAGCRLTVATLKSCRVTVLRGKSRAGRATRKLKTSGKRSSSLRVKLNRSTRKRVAHSIPGVLVTVNFLATRFSGLPASLTDSKKTRVVAPRLVVRRGATFRRGSARLTKSGRRFLTSVAKQVKKAKRIICVAHADAGSSPALAATRASTACATLSGAGLRAKFRPAGRTAPRGRTVTLTILR